jgi:hypothetical protein
VRVSTKKAAAMSWYRFHLFGSLPTVRKVYDYLCEDDAQARLAALDLLGAWPLVEVWQSSAWSAGCPHRLARRRVGRPGHDRRPGAYRRPRQGMTERRALARVACPHCAASATLYPPDRTVCRMPPLSRCARLRAAIDRHFWLLRRGGLVRSGPGLFASIAA